MSGARSPRDPPRACSPTARSSEPISETPMLEVRNLAASYGKHLALAGVDLDVKPGEIVVMLGANGAGKSTLLKSIAVLVQPQAGSRVTFDGQDLLALA